MKQQPKPKKALGHPIEWSNEDIDQLAQVTPTDKKAAAVLWRNEAPAKLKNLLQARVEENSDA